MPLSEKEKRDAEQSLATLVDLDEPDALVASLRVMCERKAQDKLIVAGERERWRNAEKALSDVLGELERANAPKPKPAGPSFAPDPDNPQSVETD